MISILMPIYNGIEFINESVLSILQQTYDKWELLIGINGHPPNSDVYKKALYFSEKNEKIKVFNFYTIKGKSNTLNELIKYCKYDYVALLDVDDIWHPRKLEIQSVFLNNYDIIGTRCIYIGDRDGTIPPIPENDLTRIDFTNVNPIINSSALIKKELCWWDSQFDGIEDYDMWIRLKLQNKSFYNCPQILVKHRIHNASAFNSDKRNIDNIPNLLRYHNLI